MALFGKKETPVETPVSHTAALEGQLAALTADRDAKDEKCKSLQRGTVTSKGVERAGLLQDLEDARGELSLIDAELARLRADLEHSRFLDARAAKSAKFHNDNPQAGEAAEAAIEIIQRGVRALSEACALGRAVAGLSFELGGQTLGYSLHPSILTGIDEQTFERLYVGAEISRFDLVRWPTLRVANEVYTSIKNGGLEDEDELARGRTLDAELAVRGTATK